MLSRPRSLSLALNLVLGGSLAALAPSAMAGSTARKAQDARRAKAHTAPARPPLAHHAGRKAR